MTEPSKNNDNNSSSNSNDNEKPNDQSRENLFKIMDGIIHQLNNTKKMFIIMIITIMIIPPLSFAITFALFGPPLSLQERGEQQQPSLTALQSHGFGHPRNHFFSLTRFIPILISIIWLGIGIKQWFVLSKWTKKYERYKELQKKIDKKLLDFDDDEK